MLSLILKGRDRERFHCPLELPHEKLISLFYLWITEDETLGGFIFSNDIISILAQSKMLNKSY